MSEGQQVLYSVDLLTGIPAIAHEESEEKLC